VMSVFFAFLAARHRAILFSIFVLLLIFIARWKINMMMMMMFSQAFFRSLYTFPLFVFVTFTYI